MGDRQIRDTETQQVAVNHNLLPEELFSRSAKVASAIGQGLAEGTGEKLLSYSKYVVEKPAEAVLHGVTGAAFGLGLALVNKKLACAAGAMATGEMLLRGVDAWKKSSDSVGFQFTTGMGSEATKKAISSKFGQLSADVLAMSATGLVLGGATRLGMKVSSKLNARENKIRESEAVLQRLAKNKEDKDLEELFKVYHHEKHLDNKLTGVIRLKEQDSNRLPVMAHAMKQIHKPDTALIEEGMGRNQLLAEATRSMKVARTDLNTSLTHMIEKFTDSKDGEFLKMSPIARNEMIENLSTLSKEVNSTSPIAHAENLTTLARVHKFNSRREDELGLLREAQAILDKQVKLTPGRTSMEISKDRFPHERNLTDLADCYAALGIKESAISTAQRIVKLQEALHGPHAGNTVNALNNLGKVSYKVGEPTKALIAFESAAESHGYVEGINHKMFFKPTCNSLSELHQYFAGEGQVDQAKRCLELLKFWNS